MYPLMRRRIVTIASLFALAAGCDGNPVCPAEQCVCAADGCACPDGTACGGFAEVVGCNVDGSSCNLTCDPGSPCVGSCGASCNLECDGTSCDLMGGSSTSVRCLEAADCDVTCEGDSCSLSCESGSSCDFTCTGSSCSMSCAPDASCRMRCPGDDGLQEVVEGRSC